MFIFVKSIFSKSNQSLMDLNPKFKLLNRKSTVPTSIRLFLYFNKKRFVYGTGKSILPFLWDEALERPTKNRYQINKAKIADPDIKTHLSNINTYLNNINDEVKRFFAKMEQQEKEVNAENLKDHLDYKFRDKEIVHATTENLNEFITRYINELQSGKRLTPKGQQYSKGTIKNYMGFQVQFDDYQTANFKKLDFEDITIDFYDNYLYYFNQKNYSPNTIGRHIKQLKAIMRASAEEKLHTNMEFTRKKFKTITEETDAIYLTEDELRKLYQLDLSVTPTLELTRDVFLIGCWTAQRFSDYSRIKKENLATTAKGNQVLELIQKKTGIKVVIPIRPDLDTILRKYDYTVPKTYEQKVNSRIKEVGKLAGIDSMEIFEQTKGGLKIKKRVAKYELIKTEAVAPICTWLVLPL